MQADAQAPAAPRSGAPALVAVLAGGGGRRVGGGKPAAMLAGHPLLHYPLAAAEAAGLEAVVVAKRSSRLPPTSCEIVWEPEVPMHPLCGVVAALEHAGGRAVLTLGCDLPLLTGELVGSLARMQGAAVVSLHGRAQPSIARWLPDQLPELRRALERQAAMREVVSGPAFATIDENALRSFGDPETLCFNVNEPEDLTRASALLRSRSRLPG